MVAPCAASDASTGPVEIEITGPLVSKPYVTMTVAVMEAFGAHATADKSGAGFHIERSGYRAADYAIEPDASAASYFWAAAAIAGGRVRVDGLSRTSLQGDVAFCHCLEMMGCRVQYDSNSITVERGPLKGIDVDMNAISDTVQTLSVVALFAQGTTRIRGVDHIRHKETDRLAALAAELRKLGADGSRAIRWARDHARSVARRGDRYVQRSPHGHELRLGGVAHTGRSHQRSRLHGEDLPAVL